ncbi:DUF4890 domain-containing protein [uncultured Alistipes sp.]|uniref:DUF4890 domain-containing protein n=1 Tax=uncultured Alistipes sp. TaxID=538949 RepID=UPI00261D3080|nr:DUF4890 domain-containing protein [uncultured Alistipes sp.]
MKKRMIAAVMGLCLLAGTSAFAQDTKPAPAPKTPPTAEQIAQRQTERMTQQLGLTDAQAKQVYELNLEQIKQMQAHREQMRAARNAEAEKMKKILSTEQFMQWAQMQGPRPGEGRGPQAMHQGKNCPKECVKDCPKECRKHGRKACDKQRPQKEKE